MSWIERAPLPWVGLAFFAALMLAYGASQFAGRRFGPKDDRGGYMVSSALVLLGLLMTFSVGVAQERLRLRQDLAVSEANAIGTSYLRVQLLDPPWRARLGRDLLSYAETRARFATGEADNAKLAGDTGRLQTVIWGDVAGAIRSNSTPTLHHALVIAVNDMFDQAAAARAARDTRVPLPVLRILIACSITAAAVVGYAEAAERRWNFVAVALLGLLTLCFMLILDLDRPVSGRVRVNQAPLVWALEDIRAQEKASAGAPEATPCADPRARGSSGGCPVGLGSNPDIAGPPAR